MKITIEHYKKKYSIETKHDDLGADEFAQIIAELMIGIGYHRNSVMNAFDDIEV